MGSSTTSCTVELLGAEKTFRLVRRLVNFRPSKIQDAPLYGARHLDWQLCDSELEAHRGYLRMDDDYVRVLTLKELPSETRPLLLNGLLDIPANFHVVTEWHPVDNAQGPQGDQQSPPSSPQLQDQLRLESPGPPERRTT